MAVTIIRRGLLKWTLLLVATFTWTAAPVPARAADQPAAAPASTKVDLNTASEKDLEQLPGVGLATAKKIVANRPYTSAAQLSKAGLSAAKIARIEPLVVFAAGSAPVTSVPKIETPKTDTPITSPPVAIPDKTATAGGKVNLNTATDKELEELPGVGPSTAKKIISGRPYTRIEDIAKAGISASTLAKLQGRITVSGAAASTPATPAASADEKTLAEPKTSGVTQTPPIKGMVWVNTDSHIYHMEGDRWYGKTKDGKFMTEDDAKKAGFREAK